MRNIIMNTNGMLNGMKMWQVTRRQIWVWDGGEGEGGVSF